MPEATSELNFRFRGQPRHFLAPPLPPFPSHFHFLTENRFNSGICLLPTQSVCFGKCLTLLKPISSFRSPGHIIVLGWGVCSVWV